MANMVGTRASEIWAAQPPEAETMEKALVLADREGRRFFLVERAQAGMLAPAPGQLDAPADHLGQRRAGADFIENLGWEGHRRGGFSRDPGDRRHRAPAK